MVIFIWILLFLNKKFQVAFGRLNIHFSLW
jgi:hypothetical protein